LPYSAIFILFTVHYYFDTWIQMLIKSCVNHYFSLSFLRKKTLKKYVDMFIENAVETAKIAVDSCYVLRQFLTPLPSIDFREIRGLVTLLCWGINFCFLIQNDWKLQISQGYIIRILQHFATKLWNITNFVMLFQAVMTFLSRSKFSL
jgi:hypothetical protein